MFHFFHKIISKCDSHHAGVVRILGISQLNNINEVISYVHEQKETDMPYNVNVS